MFPATLILSNNYKRSLACFHSEDSEVGDDLDFQNEVLMNPIFKKLKRNDNQESFRVFHERSQQFPIIQPHFSHEFDYVEELKQRMNLSCSLQNKLCSFVDPDLFFESTSDSNKQQDAYSVCNEDVVSIFESPLRSPQIESPSPQISSHYYEEPESPQQQQQFVEISIPMETRRASSADNIEALLATISSDNSLLIRLADKVLSGETLKEQEMDFLNPVEKCIVQAVAEKKRRNPNKNRDKGLKREEEKQKFFFKSLLKYTESKFYSDEKKSKKTKKRQLEKNSYYDHYWGQVAARHKIDISNFYHPGKQVCVSSQSNTNAQPRLAKNRRLKSINTTFIDLVLMSENFREDAKFYLDCAFVQENVNSRSQKIGKILEKIRVVAKQAIAKSFNLSFEEKLKKMLPPIESYIILNNKTKLPWSTAELVETKDFAQVILSKKPLSSSPL